MWISLNTGFYSATQRKASDIQDGDNRTLQIRARDPKHLDNLRERYMQDELGPTVELDYRDYQARAYCTPEAWGRALYQMSMEIDYNNFKDSVTDEKLHNAYMKVWSAMAASYGTAYNRGKGGVSRYGTTTRYYGSGYAGTGYGRGYTTTSGGKYESMFGIVEDDNTPMYRSAANMIADKPFAESDYSNGFDGDVVYEDDLFPEHSAESIEDMISRYAPFVSPESAPAILTRGEVVAWLGTTNSMFKKFLAGNGKWRSYRTGSQNRYEFPKEIMGEMQEHFDIWMSERLEDSLI